MGVRFGTDGVRGLANRAITAELALAVGRATARVFPGGSVVLGRDTRRSGSMLESAVAAGVCAEGADAVLLGVAPTPAVAAHGARHGVAGVVVSASHNPFEDNGLKVFAPGGRKLDDEQQERIEVLVAELLAGAEASDRPPPVGAEVGIVRHDPDGVSAYLDGIVAAVGDVSLAGLHVVVDAANGANSHAAPELLERLGARVEVIGNRPDGTNINDGCGSTDTGPLAERVLGTGADVGIAFDGDADRVLAVDGTGALVDGDRIIALCATDLRDRGRLAADTVVVTVMSNLGFRRAMASAGIAVVETPVGDRHVLEALRAGGFSLGGEQSGHLVFAELATTGDGLLAAVVLLDLVRRAERPLAELATEVMSSVPQRLVNVATPRPAPDIVERIRAELDAASERLGGDGRVLVRPSGTEAVVRVMVEAVDAGARRRGRSAARGGRALVGRRRLNTRTVRATILAGSIGGSRW